MSTVTEEPRTEAAGESRGWSAGSAIRAVAQALGLRRFIHTIRHLPDRLRHGSRRSAIIAYLRSAPAPKSVLFVCHGNIYRSPYAAYVFRAMLPAALRDNIEITSAGFVGPGRPAPVDAMTLATGQGLDLSSHRSSLLTAERVRGSSLVVVMDAHQKRAVQGRFGLPPETVIVLGDLDPEPIDTRTIRDPWAQPEEVLRASFARIRRCVHILAGAISDSR